MPDIFALHTSNASPAGLTVLYTFTVAFLMSMLLAITYIKTFRSLSYSRNYVQSLVLGAIVASVIMQAIGDSLARGLGMIGALAVIRFKTNFKDPRDIIFLFASMATGIATGVYAYSVAIVGTLFFCVISFVLYYVPFQQENLFDGIVRFTVTENSNTDIQIEQILKMFCKLSVIISIRESGNKWDYAYHVKLRSNKSKSALVENLREINTVSSINLLLQETTVEL